MDHVTLSTQNRLFWLGRYSERVYTTIQVMLEQCDQLIDGAAPDYKELCKKLGISCDYADAEDFCRRFLFDAASPVSVTSNVENMLGNGMVLREIVSTPTLAYLQMAHNAMELASQSDGAGIQLQWVLDDIMAFRGSMDDAVENEKARNIVKAGELVERVSLMIRLGWHLENLDRELRKLMSRLYKTHLTTDEAALDVLTGKVIDKKEPELSLLLTSIENLFQV